LFARLGDKAGAERVGREPAERLIREPRPMANDIAHRLVFQRLDNSIMPDAPKQLAFRCGVAQGLAESGL